ncbi:MAG: histidine--tRNA ligase [Thermodesulfovibrionales bacterium]|nr:histidine--tRNA ligase [Thermodesulfovibrionales bacterium]
MRFSRVKGVHDIYAPEVYLYQKIEEVSQEFFRLYGFKEIRLPIIEYTELFRRSIGTTTDIVEKEMYTFNDKAGRSITLRPEGTAGAVRAYIENGLYNLPVPQKFYYTGPMFRYERPQAGRFRQFHQIGVEAFGIAEPRMDAEVMLLLRSILNKLGFQDLTIELNSLGCSQCRPRYREKLIEFFSGRIKAFCTDCQRRFEKNPLRLLDCKVPGCIKERGDAPSILDFLCKDCLSHFDKLRSYLEYMGILYTVKPDLVRGLDYYTRTIFEVKSESLGAQNAIAAGGRYDNLVEEFGGPPTPATGFAIGMERLVSLLKEREEIKEKGPHFFLAFLGDEAERVCFKIAERLREKGLWVELGTGSSLKSQLRRADRLKSEYVIIIGEDELKRSRLRWKRLSDGSEGEIGEQDIESLAINKFGD